jgi:hypothetical protein
VSELILFALLRRENIPYLHYKWVFEPKMRLRASCYGRNFDAEVIVKEIDDFNAANREISRARGVRYVDVTQASRDAAGAGSPIPAFTGIGITFTGFRPVYRMFTGKYPAREKISATFAVVGTRG